MPTGSPRRALLGRRRESEALDRLLDAVRGGESRALVLRGEAGVGKTALLDHAIERATGFRVARAAGVQSEMELPFAGLHQLCASMLDRLACLPGPQRNALDTAFGLAAGSAPDLFVVGLAVLSLLSVVAEERPLLCVVDDSQLLDRASARALAFVARRLGHEAVALIFAVREHSEELTRLPELLVEGLRNGEARRLLGSAAGWPLDERVRDRIVAETHGNPLALLELPRGLKPGEPVGGFWLPVALPLSERIEESFRRRLKQLPTDTQRLLLVAAAEPVGDPVLLWRAVERLGLSSEAGGYAEAAGLLEIRARVRFRHPLVRSAVYGSASPEARQEVHLALAEATDPQLDPDRRAWHHAQAVSGPDEEVASELVRSAGRAQARGGVAAAAAFLERASYLTPEPVRRAKRALAAAQTKYEAGALEDAVALLATAEAGALDDLERARVHLLRGQIAFAARRGSDAAALLLSAARELDAVDPSLARATYLDALAAALFAGRLAIGGSAVEVAKAALAVRSSPQPPRACDLLLDGLALQIADGPSVGIPVLKRAVGAFRVEEVATEDVMRWLWLAGRAAGFIWDYDGWDALTARQLKAARDVGALAVLPLTLSTRASVRLFAGELSDAASLFEESTALAAATGVSPSCYGALTLAAFRGHADDTARLIDACTSDSIARGEGNGLTLTQWATALFCNGLRRYDDALAAAEQAVEDPRELWFSTWAAVELIEAASRTGNTERATGSLEWLASTARASGSDWGLGIEARSRALLSDGDEAESLYGEAIERLGRTRLRVDLARAHLLYGEWLRRERRRLDAREQLHTAFETFKAMGIEAFAGRAERELLATGARVRKRTVQKREQLTVQESQVARLARAGLSNAEIGGQLFISKHTVAYHLRKVFDKLDITSRSQLERALPDSAGGGQVA
jgi:DNA-binding CsgD family transcriptional regulator/tetratricopeptide (TPR) repeat protein